MENVNWLKLKLEKKMMNLQSLKAQTNANLSFGNANTSTDDLIQRTQNKIINKFQTEYVNPKQLRMNNLASIDRAVYVKKMLNLPKNMVELLVMVQNDGKMPAIKSTKNLLNDIQQQNNQSQQQNQNTLQNLDNAPRKTCSSR